MDVEVRTASRSLKGRELPVLVWRFAVAVRAIASGPHGGGRMPGGGLRRQGAGHAGPGHDGAG